MASKLPYMASPGLIPKIFTKIQEARRPERFTQDFLGTKLGFSGGSAMAVIPLLKRMGFLSSDGSPTKLYDQFRNESTRGAAMNTALRTAYAELFERNEYAHELTKDKLLNLIVEITGSSKDDTTTRCTVATFSALKEFADFDANTIASTPEQSKPTIEAPKLDVGPSMSLSTENQAKDRNSSADDVSFAVSYTINLNLPETTNPEVFNSIFRALKEHLLTRR